MNADITNTPRPAGRRSFGRGGMGLTAGALLLAGSLAGWTAADAVGTSAAAVPPAPAGGACQCRGAHHRRGRRFVRADRRPDCAGRRDDPFREARSVASARPCRDDPLFRQFFGDRFRGPRAMPERREGALGSGVIVRADGYVLTNHHVDRRRRSGARRAERRTQREGRRGRLRRAERSGGAEDRRARSADADAWRLRTGARRRRRPGARAIRSASGRP